MFYKAARVEYHPLGVVGAIVPWNYPFHNVFNPLSAALFAGNAIVIKVGGPASVERGRAACAEHASDQLAAACTVHLWLAHTYWGITPVHCLRARGTSILLESTRLSVSVCACLAAASTNGVLGLTGDEQWRFFFFKGRLRRCLSTHRGRRATTAALSPQRWRQWARRPTWCRS